MDFKSTLGVLAVLIVVLAYFAWPESEEPRSDLPKRIPVQGQVTYNGEPPVGAYVRLIALPFEQQRASAVVPRGRVEEDGTFQLQSFETNDGAIPGDYALTLVWTGFADRHVRPGPDRWKGKYDDPRDPVQTVKVEGDAVEIPLIALTGPAIRSAEQKPADTPDHPAFYSR